jgi:ribosomal protein L11 methyltransferase
VRVTQENAKMNHLDAFVQAQVSEGFSAINNRTFDIITANILAGPLCQMASRMIQALAPAGYVVLAGLLNRQAEDVIDSYRSVGAKLVDQLFIGDW